MTTIQTIHQSCCDLNQGPSEVHLKTPIMHQDALGDVFRVSVWHGNKTVDLTGMTVRGYLYFASTRQTMLLEGSITDGCACVTLTSECYAIPGYASLVVQVQDGDIRHSLLKVNMCITRTGSEIVIDPGDILPTLPELLGQIAAMEQATAEAREAAAAADAAREGIQSDLDSVDGKVELLPLPRDPFMATEVNLDELLAPGFYAIDETCTLLGAPAAMALRPHYVKVEAILRSGISWVKQTVGRWNKGNEYTRIITGAVPKEWGTTAHIVESTNDTANRTAELQLILESEKCLRLGAGDYYIDGLTMPEDSTIEGCGMNTRLISTNTEHLHFLTVGNGCTVRNVALIGLQTEQPAVGTNTAHTTRVGVYHGGYEERILISGCLVQGFGDQGIFFENGGYSVNAALIENCIIKYCGSGIYLHNTEYACVSNCSVIDNFIGVLNAGGNNKFSNCGIDSNAFGFYIGDDLEGVENHGHSSCTGCSFNHNSSRAVYIHSNPHGYVFSGCCIFDASINLSGNTAGTLFDGCEFGSGIEIVHNATGSNYFMNCIFNNLGGISHVMGEGAARARFINCYNFGTGAVVE